MDDEVMTQAQADELKAEIVQKYSNEVVNACAKSGWTNSPWKMSREARALTPWKMSRETRILSAVKDAGIQERFVAEYCERLAPELARDRRSHITSAWEKSSHAAIGGAAVGVGLFGHLDSLLPIDESVSAANGSPPSAVAMQQLWANFPHLVVAAGAVLMVLAGLAAIAHIVKANWSPEYVARDVWTTMMKQTKDKMFAPHITVSELRKRMTKDLCALLAYNTNGRRRDLINWYEDQLADLRKPITDEHAQLVLGEWQERRRAAFSSQKRANVTIIPTTRADVAADEVLAPSVTPDPVTTASIAGVRDSLQGLLDEWSDYQTNNEQYYLTMPTLHDITGTVATTVAYNQALTDLVLAVDGLHEQSPTADVAAANLLADTAWDAWHAAVEHAAAVGLDDRSTEERTALARLSRLVHRLENSPASDPELASIKTRIQSCLDKITTVSVSWATIADLPGIEPAIRRQLPQGSYS